MNHHHPATALCAWGAERKIRCLEEEESWVGAVTAFHDYDRPLEIVSSFKYLGRLMTATNKDWPTVIDNLQKSRKIWY